MYEAIAALDVSLARNRSALRCLDNIRGNRRSLEVKDGHVSTSVVGGQAGAINQVINGQLIGDDVEVKHAGQVVLVLRHAGTVLLRQGLSTESTNIIQKDTKDRKKYTNLNDLKLENIVMSVVMYSQQWHRCWES